MDFRNELEAGGQRGALRCLPEYKVDMMFLRTIKFTSCGRNH